MSGWGWLTAELRHVNTVCNFIIAGAVVTKFYQSKRARRANFLVRLLNVGVGFGRQLRYCSTMIDATLISQVKRLSAAERLELIEAVWETLSPEDALVTEGEKALLDARIADAESNPDDQRPWAEVRDRLRHHLP